MKTLGIFLVLLLSVAATFAAEPGTAPQTKQLTRSMTQTLQASSGLVPVVSETGKLAWSIDSAGTSSGSSLVTVNKPAGATVRGAY